MGVGLLGLKGVLRCNECLCDLSEFFEAIVKALGERVALGGECIALGDE